MTRLRLLLFFLFNCFFQFITAQNISITYKNADTLFVCGERRFDITLRNTGTTAATGVRAQITLPVGVRYVTGSVTGANDNAPINTSVPQFSVPDLAGGASVQFSVLLKAGCEAIAPINSGSLFTNGILATWNGGGSAQITSTPYKVETGLVLVTAVTPTTLSGQAGQIVTRTITVKNTRQGPVSQLRFTDEHLPGLSMQLAGIGGDNIGSTFFVANVPGAAFAATGDGDHLLEFNETFVLTEQISITDCQGIPFPIASVIRVGWGCDGVICQSDTAQAAVTVLPSMLNPELAFVGTYSPPLSLCAEYGTVQELAIINTGNGAAQNVRLNISTISSKDEAINGHTVRWFNGTTWLPLSVADGGGIPFKDCPRDSLTGGIDITIPFVPAGDTVLVHFESYACVPVCSNLSGIGGAFAYNKICPETEIVSDDFFFVQDTAILNIEGKVEFNIGKCLQNDAVNTFDYKVKTGLLKRDSAYLHVTFHLPWGIFWEPSCPVVLEGKAPISTHIDTLGTQETVLKLVYQLPFLQDSALGKICLRNICQDPSAYPPPIDSIPARRQPLTLFQTEPACKPCEVLASVLTQISEKPDIAEKCGYGACDEFKLVLDCGCEPKQPLIGTNFTTIRSNLGLRDDNDDRKADSNNRANPALVRLDRFMTGDTMHTTLRTKIPEGGLPIFNYRLFTELWQSDAHLNGGDATPTSFAATGFTNADQFKYLRGTLILKKANGTVFECPFFQPDTFSDMHVATIARPNVKPQKTIDNGASMFRQFTVDPAQLAATGCMPAGTTLATGDSIIISSDYQLDFNFIASFSAMPPLVNFRNTICNTDRAVAGNYDSLICAAGTLLQYTGYQPTEQYPINGIRVCENSTEILPFKFSLRIARGNLFPFEVRPIAKMQTLLHDLPSILPLPTVTLRQFNLQENTPVFVNQPMTPTLAANRIRLDFAPFFQNPIDEGFHTEVGFVFPPNCAYTGSLSNNRSTLNILYENLGISTPRLITSDTARIAYFAAAPRLNMTLNDSILLLGTRFFSTDFELKNVTPFDLSNAWVVAENDGSLEDFEILQLPDLKPVPRIGSVFQMGSLESFNSANFRLRARNNSCKKTTIKLTYGWNCTPLTSLASEICGSRTQTLQLRPLLPELDMVSPTLLSPLRLCTPSDYYEFEIYNANEGNAYDIEGSVKLPPGFTIIPNTSQLSYPAGAPFVSLPEPQLLPGNTWQWMPAAASNILKNNGLSGFSKAPDNSLRIRFKVQAACGATANTQPVFGAKAETPCGANTNILRKPGPPIAILGLMPSYGILASLTASGPLVCGGTLDIAASLTADGTAHNGDSLYISLPPGVSYVAGSYIPKNHAPAGQPLQTGAVLKLPLPLQWPVGSAMTFTFKIQYDTPADCNDKTITLATREKATTSCGTQNCDAFVATGETALQLSTRNPELILKNPMLTILPNNQPGFSGVLENISTFTAFVPVVQVYYDANGNGLIEAGEPLTGTFQQPLNMNPGVIRNISGPLSLPPGANYCNLIAVIPAVENCACATRTYPFGNRITIATAIGRCKVEAVDIKEERLAGHTYQWLTTTGIGCTTCPNTTYTPGPDIQVGQLVTLLLEDRMGDCVIERRYDLQFGGPLGMITPNKTICKGESVLLEATPGGTYAWSGAGATGNTTASVLVQPSTTGVVNYRVTVTLPGGCIGSGLARITVLRPDTLTLAPLRTCQGNPVRVLDETTDQPGKYFRILTGSDGCDSVILQELKVFPNLTQEIKPLCQGDSIQIFNNWVKKPGVVCQSFSGFSGCDSLHCVDVKILAPPVLPVPDSVVLTRGQTVTLIARPGLAQYVWTPANDLSCNNCPNPNATPDSSIVYTLRATDNNGCEAEVSYRILVFPPCFEGLAIPNVFTPDGDQINDVFRAVPRKEGYEKVRSLTIYNRWGEKVFSSTADNPQWDGTTSGKPAPTDVYYWLMTFDCRGEYHEEKGPVTLLR